MSIIVIEGVDGSGKTTLIENLKKTIPCWTVSRSGRIKNLDELKHFINFTRVGGEYPIPIIIDRHPIISEKIYGRVLRGGDITNGLGTLSLLQAYDFIDKIIYCRPEEKDIHANIWKNPQMKGVPEHLPKLLEAYDNRMLNMSHMRKNWVKVYNYNVNKIEEVTEWIVS